MQSLQDIGLSGFHSKNLDKDAALGSFLEAVQAGRVQTPCALVVESLDRISRAEILDALSTFTTLIKAGVEVHTLSDRQVYSKASISDTWTQLIISLSVMARGREESQIKSDRIKAAYASKYQSGKVYGRSYPAWLDKTPEGFKLNPEKVEVLHRIISLYKSGYGFKRIAGLLNEEGIKSFSKGTNNRTGNQYWFQATISKYIKSPALCGHQDTKHGLVEDCYPAVITEDEYNILQAQKKANTKLAGSSPRSCNSVFTGIAKCWHCGYSMQYNRYKTKAGYKHYIRCRGSIREGICDQLFVPYDTAQTYAFLALESLVQGVYRQSEGDPLADSIRQKADQIQHLQEQADRLTDTLLMVDSSTVPSIQQKLSEIASKLQQAKADLLHYQQEKAAQESAQAGSDLQLVADFLHGITDENRTEARALLHRHIQEIRVDKQPDQTRMLLTSKYGSQQAEAVIYKEPRLDGAVGEVQLL